MPKDRWQQRLEQEFLGPLLQVFTQGLTDPLFTEPRPRLANAVYKRPTTEKERIQQLADAEIASSPKIASFIPPAFKAASKLAPLTEDLIERLKGTVVRDSKGELQQVYHGTPHMFKDFSLDAAKNSDPSYGGKGIWWTSNPRYAEQYALDEIHDLALAPKDLKSAIYRAYINIVKPFDFRNKADYSITDDIIQHGRPDYINRNGKAVPAFISESGKRYLPTQDHVATLDDAMRDLLENYHYMKSTYPNLTNADLHSALGLGTGDDWTNAIRRRGYDGIIGVSPYGSQEYAVYDPSQIISAQRIPINAAKTLAKYME